MEKNKKVCIKCGREYSGQSEICPYCNHNNSEPIKDEESLEKDQAFSQQVFKNEVIYLRKSAGLSLSNAKHLLLFFIGWLGLQFIAVILGLVVAFAAPSLSLIVSESGTFTYTVWYSAMVNLLTYGVALIVLCLILWKSLPVVLKSLKYKPLNYLIGVGIGVGLIVFSALYSYITSLMGATSNSNQTEIEVIVAAYPIASLFIFGIVGPICEEFTYRLGLFSILAKYSRVAAYLVSSILFGFIHFNFLAGSAEAYLNEFINIPFYLISGAIFALTYDKFGLQGSIAMHITNNLTSVILVML